MDYGGFDVAEAGAFQVLLDLKLGEALGYGPACEIKRSKAATLSPDAGDAFLGLQGDPWDYA